MISGFLDGTLVPLPEPPYGNRRTKSFIHVDSDFFFDDEWKIQLYMYFEDRKSNKDTDDLKTSDCVKTSLIYLSFIL